MTPPANGAFGGSTDATATLGFGPLPTDCFTWVRFESSVPTAANVPFHNGFRGPGPHTMPVQTFAVNAPTPVTITAFTQSGVTGGQVGAAQTDTMTLQPLPLNTFSIDRGTLEQSQTASGRVQLGGGTGGLDGLARVDLTANPAAAIDIPTFVNVGNQTTPAPGGSTEYVSLFAIRPRNVNQPTDVTITASRAGVNRTDNIRVMPDCRITVQLSTQDTSSSDRIRVLLTNVGASQCPQSTMGMRMFEGTTVTGPFTDLRGFGLLNVLAPNQQVNTSFIWQPVTGSGERTFQFHCCANYHPGIDPASPSMILFLTAAQVDEAAKD